jgi:hypothetical protein
MDLIYSIIGIAIIMVGFAMAAWDLCWNEDQEATAEFAVLFGLVTGAMILSRGLTL